MKQTDPQQEARRTAALLEAVAREAERLGQAQQDPAMRQALLTQVERSRADAESVLLRLGS